MTNDPIFIRPAIYFNHHFTKIIIGLAISLGMPLHAFAQSSVSQKTASQMEAEKLMGAEDYRGAIEIITDAQENGETDFGMSELLVEAYSERIEQVGILKKRKLAKKMKKAMEHSLQLEPRNVQALENLIQFHTQAPSIVGGSKEVAQSLLNDLETVDSYRAHMIRANIARQNKDFETALGHLENALKLSLNKHNPWLAKAYVKIDQEQYDSAIADLDKCLELSPGQKNCLYQTGKAASLGKTQLEKGVSSFRNFIDNAEADETEEYMAYAHYRLGVIYSLRGEVEKARLSYTRSQDYKKLKEVKKALKELD